MLRRIRKRWIILGILGILTTVAIYLLRTDNDTIWPIRNTLRYHFVHWWHNQTDHASSGKATLAGCLSTPEATPLINAWVLTSEENGNLHTSRTDSQGCYMLDSLPAGRYIAYASAPGFESQTLESWHGAFHLDDGDYVEANAVLQHTMPSAVTPGSELMISDPITKSAQNPTPTSAIRHTLTFNSAGTPNQETFVYTPLSTTEQLPTLLAVYPGLASEWETVSVPLAAAGYTVVAIGPAYSMNLEHDIAELRRLVGFIRSGAIPHASSQNIAIMGGSYSSLHVLRMLQDDAGFSGVVLLGPISDIFDMREQFEAGISVPPFGLDQALIALGWPNLEAERYARYSALYHVRPDWPPILLMHSSNDEVVPPAQSHLLVSELKAAKVSIEPYFFDGMSHYLRTDASSEELQELYDITLNFLERTN